MSGEPVLRWGSEGEGVLDLQGRLTGLGYAPGTVDGVFGPRTDAAVRAFQGDQGLVVDGIVGPVTWAALGGAPGVESPQGSQTSGASSGLAGDHVVFLTDPAVTGSTLTYRAARVDRQPMAAGAGADVWSIEGADNAMVAHDSVSVPAADAPDGAYDVAVQLPELVAGTYTVHVALMSDSAGSSEVGHASFTVGPSPAGGLAGDHVVFVTDPAVTGSTLTYRAARVDRQPMAAGTGADVWSIEGADNAMVVHDSVSVPAVDAPDGTYDVAVQLPELAAGTYTVHVSLMSDSAGSSEVGHATFTV